MRRDVRLAKSPKAQVEILAQINDVTKAAIQRVLDGESWDEAVKRERAAKKESVAPKKTERKHHKWTRAELLFIKQLREDGLTAEQIAVAFEMTPCAIKSVIQNYPKMFGRIQRHSSISEADLKRALKYRARGMTYKRIGEKLGHNWATLRAAMIAAEKRKAAHDVGAS